MAQQRGSCGLAQRRTCRGRSKQVCHCSERGTHSEGQRAAGGEEVRGGEGKRGGKKS